MANYREWRYQRRIRRWADRHPLRLATTGSSLASFLLDPPDSATRRDIIETMPCWGGAIGLFPRLVESFGPLNLGLRYDRTYIHNRKPTTDNRF